MKNLLKKELKLATSPLAWFFLAASLLTFVPGYPILLGAFFVCMGISQSFQAANLANDVLYTALLPVRKADTVAAKYISSCFFELVSFCLCAVFTVIRMTLMSGSPVYQKNALMNATPVFLAGLLLIFTLFNLIFLGGFFKTAYKTGRPFLIFIIVTMLFTGAAESLHFFPGMSWLNDPAGSRMGVQLAALAAAAVIYAALTLISEKRSEKRFEALDL